jgi:hypothetical protein
VIDFILIRKRVKGIGVVIRIHAQGEINLPGVIDAGRSFRRGPSATYGRQKLRCQNRDDCDGDQQLD